MKMLPCKVCNRKYHRSCVKNWAENRDLFHWSSWVCPHCRTCEVCRKAGDPSKFMYCKRCDAAYHCYCQQPPHKNVSRGPYLCPKHTKCHSCGSSVPGSGPSTRWFLSYTCCDACGRLFVKGNYCPVCLKVYRDSESTPMVCCDICQRWVHCSCDGISDEKYQQFQTDGNLHYKCAACRGDCYQVKDIDDAIQELWKRRDKSDKDLIASLRVAAGLPYQEDIFSISPFSDDEESSQMVMKSNNGRSLKFSVKGLSEKAVDTAKEYGKKTPRSSSSSKKHAKKKGSQVKIVNKSEEKYQDFERQDEVRSVEGSSVDEKNGDTKPFGIRGQENLPLHLTISLGHKKEKSPVNEHEKESHRIRKDSVASSLDKVPKVEIKTSKSHGTTERSGKLENKSEPVKGPKLVIHFGSRSKNISSSPTSEASSCHRQHDLVASNGSKHDRVNESKHSKHREREVTLKKHGKDSEMTHANVSRGTVSEGHETALTDRHIVLRRRGSEGSNSVRKAAESTPGNDAVAPPADPSVASDGSRGDSRDPTPPPAVADPSKDSKPLLKLKFKNLYSENRSSWVSQGEENHSVKKQRSKRMRPSPLMEKSGSQEDEPSKDSVQENMSEEVMDANWILQKLGKGAIGKRVEVQQSGGSWHKGVVSDVIEGTSSLLVRLDDGGTKTLELGKHGIRFISQKHKRTRL
ncbi:unnamed protein product [Spirodela intermedia]|uniref:PHD-type domain-containing protein n=1 Tax=Spirodela intermedia TaxID=51605 RepID=A0A7I8KCC6_SPIIN|nr:unnamed protein product [Spirodela intermedia]